jgi:hypothetical protein
MPEKGRTGNENVAGGLGGGGEVGGSRCAPNSAEVNRCAHLRFTIFDLRAAGLMNAEGAFWQALFLKVGWGYIHMDSGPLAVAG